jgi:hypothetical protein
MRSWVRPALAQLVVALLCGCAGGGQVPGRAHRPAGSDAITRQDGLVDPIILHAIEARHAWRPLPFLPSVLVTDAKTLYEVDVLNDLPKRGYQVKILIPDKDRNFVERAWPPWATIDDALAELPDDLDPAAILRFTIGSQDSVWQLIDLAPHDILWRLGIRTYENHGPDTSVSVTVQMQVGTTVGDYFQEIVLLSYPTEDGGMTEPAGDNEVEVPPTHGWPGDLCLVDSDCISAVCDHNVCFDPG